MPKFEDHINFLDETQKVASGFQKMATKMYATAALVTFVFLLALILVIAWVF